MTPAEEQERRRRGLDPEGMLNDGTLAVCEAMAEGVRKKAREQNRSPFDWKWYGWWLALLSSSDEQLTLVVAREAGCRLRQIDGVPTLVPFGERPPMRIPSRACATYLCDLVQRLTTWTPSDRGVRRAMAILEQRATHKEGRAA